MALGRTYTVDSGLVTLASTTQTAILASNGLTTLVADIEAVRVSISSGAGVSYPSNGTVNFLLARTTAAAAGGAAVTPNPHNPSDIVARTAFLSGTTAITGITTPGVTLWSQNLPFTSGANWAEWVTPGAEWRTAASATAGVALYITCTSAGTATQFQCELVFSE
jgi:hypothetical protein